MNDLYTGTPVLLRKLDNNQRNRLKLEIVANFRLRYPNLDVKLLQGINPLQNINLSRGLMANIGLPPTQVSIICGTLMGDSSLKVDTNYANARMQMRHSTRQAEWFLWKVFCAYDTLATETSITLGKPDGKALPSPEKETKLLADGETLGKFHVATNADERLTRLQQVVCNNNGYKEIKRCWLNHMDSYFLMTLWLDDGSLSGGRRQGIFCLNSTPGEQLKILAAYMKTVWDVECKVKSALNLVTNTNPDPYTLIIVDLENLERFLRIIAPIIPVKSMLYKVCLKPISRTRRERWTSELKRMVRPDWHDEIDKIYAN